MEDIIREDIVMGHIAREDIIMEDITGEVVLPAGRKDMLPSYVPACATTKGLANVQFIYEYGV